MTLNNRNGLFLKFFKLLALGTLLTAMGCTALKTSVKKSQLVVQTQMSSTIYLDPVPEVNKTVFLQLRNTSDKQVIDYEAGVRQLLLNKGYTIVADANSAHYWIQANVLQVSRIDLRLLNENEKDETFNAAVVGAEIGRQFGDGKGKVAATVVGGLIGVITDALVSDIEYVMITDLQISEKVAAKVKVHEATDTTLEQGEATTVKQSSQQTVQRKKYQTRITSTANQVNLTFDEAKEQLLEGLIASVSSIL